MADKPQITDLNEAKAAIDAEIVELRWWVDLYAGKVAAEQASLDRYQKAFWVLRDLRERMEPVVEAAQAIAAEPERKAA